MTLEDAVNKADFILPGHKQEFIAELEKFPEGIESWLYSNSITDSNDIYQGDVAIDIPHCFIDDSGDGAFGKTTVSFISNTCDMQPNREDYVIVAPFISIEDYHEKLKSVTDNTDSINNKITSIKENKVFSCFYMPSSNTLPEGFIDFTNLASIDRDYIINLKKNSSDKFILSLSQKGFYLLLIKLNYFFARSEN